MAIMKYNCELNVRKNNCMNDITIYGNLSGDCDSWNKALKFSD